MQGAARREGTARPAAGARVFPRVLKSFPFVETKILCKEEGRSVGGWRRGIFSLHSSGYEALVPGREPKPQQRHPRGAKPAAALGQERRKLRAGLKISTFLRPVLSEMEIPLISQALLLC